MNLAAELRQDAQLGFGVDSRDVNLVIGTPAQIHSMLGFRYLCNSSEGWAVLVDGRFTRCFLFAFIALMPNAIALLACLAQLVQLPRERSINVSTDAKLVSALTLIVCQILIWIMMAYESYKAFVLDVGMITAVLSIFSLLIVAMLTFRERFFSPVPSGSILMFWLFHALTTITAAVSLKSPWLYFSALIGVMSLVVELYPRRQLIYAHKMDPRLNNPYDMANIFSRLSFSWMSPLMALGYQQYLVAEDLPNLTISDSTDKCANDFLENWKTEVHKKENPSIGWAITKTFGGTYLLGGFFKIIQDILAFVQPQLLRLLIAFVQRYTDSDGNESLANGIYISLAMFVVSFVQTVALHQYFERVFTTGMRVKAGVTSAIFRKSLLISSEARSQRSIGDTVNIMSIDTQRLQDVAPNGNILWSGPFQIALCLVSLYDLLGNAMWAGVLVLVIMIPVNSYVASAQKTLQKDQMKNKDRRTRLTSELLANIKSIKLYAWEEPFVDRLKRVRHDFELVSLRKLSIFNALISFLWNFAPFLVSFTTFAFYMLINKDPLTSEKIFPALALFNLLGFPLAMLPMLISSAIEAFVASQRIRDFLLLEERQPNAIIRFPAPTNVGETALEIQKASFKWQKDSPGLVLENISLKIAKGELLCVVGRVGAGKSSLLQAVLGDMHKVNGSVGLHGSLAYVAQDAWIFNGSVRDNILFGCKYDESIYQEVIAACALVADLEVLPDGENTIVGEKGISLSGGQKARISLARAVYARADIYLLDDPLSAVDEHVGKHIIDHVLGKNGLLASKCICLATNSISVLKHADRILMLSRGRIVDSGTAAESSRGDGKIGKLIREFSHSSQTPHRLSDETTTETIGEIFGDASVKNTISETDAPKLSSRRGSMGRSSAASLTVSKPMGIRKEHMEQGKVSWMVYYEYFKVCGLFLVTLFMITLLIANGLSVGGNFWLKHWSEINADNELNQNVEFYLGVYGAFGVSSAFFTILQNLLLMLGCNLRSARILHDRMLDSVIRAPMVFFETTPLGRIINRFSNDVYRVDQQLIRVFYQMINNVIRVFYTIIVISIGTPAFLFFVVPLSLLYFYYQRYYLRTSRELKRLDSVLKSPIFAQFQETLDGISTVRAFGQTKRFIFLNEHYIDASNKAYFPSISANRWLAFRLEFVGSVIIFASSALSVLSLPSGRVSSGLIGLALSYALQVTQSLNWIVRMTVEVETNIVSVERMLEYSSLSSEAPLIIENNRPQPHWPDRGGIEFKNYSSRYRPELPLVLKNISLDIKPGEKVGIVGRTGAGKSSLTMALFRMIEPVNGNIDIDKLNTSTIGLHDLRNHLSIIPQDSQLFEGTLRDNLDPEREKSDTELWRAVDLSHLRAYVESVPGGLDSRVSEGGGNMSAGQKQLVCLARALLTDTKVLVLDEATAAVDVETDQWIQETIRTEFSSRTILTIAHRLNTIMKSDRIVVLSFGEIAETGKPSELLADTNSLFYGLCEQGGLVQNGAQMQARTGDDAGQTS